MRTQLAIIAVLSAAMLGVGSSHAAAQRRPKASARGSAGTAVTPAPSAQQGNSPAGEAPAAVPAGGSEPSAATPASSSEPPSAQVTVKPAAQEPAAPATNAGADAASGEAAPAPEAALQKELSEVMDTLVQARARAAVLGKALWKTKVTIEVENDAEPDQVAVRVSLWLDGAPVWTGDGSGLRDPKRTLFSGFIAPGQHVLTYEVEQRARADEKYRYTQRASHRFTALKERRTDLKLVLDDDSDIADEFADDEEGEYDVRARLHVRAIAPEDE